MTLERRGAPVSRNYSCRIAGQSDGRSHWWRRMRRRRCTWICRPGRNQNAKRARKEKPVEERRWLLFLQWHHAKTHKEGKVIQVSVTGCYHA